MFRLPQLFGFGMLALALMVSGAVSQDKKEDKKEEKKSDKKKDEKKKDGLPGFKGIEFTPEQLEKIAGVRKERKPELDDLGKKIGELNKKVNELKKAELDAILSLLTSEQRKIYTENTAKKKGGEKKKDEKKKDEKKKDEKKDDKK